MRLMASSPNMQSPRSRATRAGWRARAGFSKASPASVSGLPCRLKVEMRLIITSLIYLGKLPLPETRMGRKNGNPRFEGIRWEGNLVSGAGTDENIAQGGVCS